MVSTSTLLPALTVDGNMSSYEQENVSTTALVPTEKSWATIQDNFYTATSIILPILLCTGLFGNTLTIITMMSKEFQHMTSRFILIALAFSDATLLLTQPFNKLFVQKLFGSDPRALSAVGCKAFFHIFKTAKMTSSWLIVILCFERFVAVVFPLKVKTIVTKKTIIGLIVLDYIFIGTYNAVWTFSSLIVDGVCKPDVTTPETKLLYRDFLIAGSSFYSLIPMILMVILTPIIVYKLILQSKLRRRMAKAGAKNDSDTVRISAMLIGVVVAYITLIFPITLVHNLAFYRNVSAFDTNSLGFFVLREVAQTFEQLNYSTNFILYVMCSSTFRARVLVLLGINRCRKSNMTGPLNNGNGKPLKQESIESGSSSKTGTDTANVAGCQE